MPNLREETLNSYLALLLDAHDGISATAEDLESGGMVDITVQHDAAERTAPILIEAKLGDTKAKRRQAAKQAQPRLKPRPELIARGLCYPERLEDGWLSF